MWHSFLPALRLLFALSLLTGIAYPLALTGLAQVLFPVQAHGSLIEHDGKIIGSARIGQAFSDPRDLWGRPSATTPVYNAAASAGSNLGPTHPALETAVRARIATLKASDPAQTAPIPVDLVTASASGLDPDISPAAAAWQAPRIARARGLPLADVHAIITRHTQGRWLGVLGEARVNVLGVNRALNSAKATP